MSFFSPAEREHPEPLVDLPEVPAGTRPDLVARLRAAGCVFAEEEAALFAAAAVDDADLERMVVRRLAGVPVEHVLGWAAFGRRRIVVDPGVFVPRHRTVFLLDVATSFGRRAVERRRGAVVVDLCCGTGALGAIVAVSLRGQTAVPGQRAAAVELHASDIDPVAVRCARRNVAPLGGQVHEGDLYAALPASLRGRVDLLIANAPYVPTGAIGLLPPEAREHEASVALDGGPDGLDVLRRVLAGAAPWLAEDGRLFVEISEGQEPGLAAAAGHAGLACEFLRSEDHEATVAVVSRLGPG